MRKVYVAVENEQGCNCDLCQTSDRQNIVGVFSSEGQALAYKARHKTDDIEIFEQELQEEETNESTTTNA